MIFFIFTDIIKPFSEEYNEMFIIDRLINKTASTKLCWTLLDIYHRQSSVVFQIILGISSLN